MNVLTIAGSDSSGGAGIQADIKTMTVHKIYGQSVITAITAQNTMGVSAVFDIPPNIVEAQLDAVFSDIVPDAIKIGMVSSPDIIKTIAQKLSQYKGKNIVLDPVMIATSGARLISEEAIQTLKEELIPLAQIITPNIMEAEELSGIKIGEYKDVISAGLKLSEELQVPVLIKGGHLEGEKTDILFIEGEVHPFFGETINNPNTHGTGCTLSSAIACNLAKGHDLQRAVAKAKDYVHGAIDDQMNLGKGRGPLNHMYLL